jgi:hypothetical protein
MSSFFFKFTSVLSSDLQSLKLLISYFLLGMPETLLCLLSGPHVRTVPLLNEHER